MEGSELPQLDCLVIRLIGKIRLVLCFKLLDQFIQIRSLGPKLQWIKRLSRASFLRNRTGAARILARIEVRPYIMLFLSAIYCNAGSTSGVQVTEAVLTSPSTVVQRSVNVCSFSSVGALVKTITGYNVSVEKSLTSQQ